MKYAIIEVSGKQFWIEVGKYYDLNRITVNLGKEIILNRVLLLNNEGDVLIGKPYLDSVSIQGKVLEHLEVVKRLSIKWNQRKKPAKNKDIVKN